MIDFKKKPIIAMLHLKGHSGNDKFERMKRETDIYLENGVDAVLVENYFGDVDDCVRALYYLHTNMPDVCYGVNILGDTECAFQLTGDYEADFIQIDSVCGHLKPQEDCKYAEFLDGLRKKSNAAVLGGVRFKYQPILSGRSLEEDMKIGQKRCDAIVTTGDGTGIDCPTEKLAEFKKLLGDFPLVVGAGVTTDTVAEKLKFADAVIIGSWLKEGHSAGNDVSEEYVKLFMEEVNKYRQEAGLYDNL